MPRKLKHTEPLGASITIPASALAHRVPKYFKHEQFGDSYVVVIGLGKDDHAMLVLDEDARRALLAGAAVTFPLTELPQHAEPTQKSP